ncbi:hypothetical protein A1Q2_04617 [Trichosporon asahii var. asahii CBS 8904]|uniref:Uncharacterized protein n=1 Tax=Trichosporon asahii var. asahii (strain CBS 8904) TaxID=1220162 RepID=K1WI85_TRIAC|nr:hypothetical protein A1Q2_04617 [Trichosporon asahii var. asahii CBS 8904]
MSSSVPSLPSTTVSAVPSASASPLPTDVAPRPSSGPQPPTGRPFFFNPTHSDEAQVCYFLVEAPNEKEPYYLPPPELRKIGESYCSDIGIWNKDLFACRTETANSTAVFETRAKGNQTSKNKTKCRPYGEYEESIRSAFWAEPQWPEHYDNSTHSIAIAYGTFNGTSTGARCCMIVNGDPVESTGKDLPYSANSPNPSNFSDYRNHALSPCLVIKDKGDKYKECILSTDYNALPMVESFRYYEVKSDSGQAATHKTALSFTLLAVATALFASVA